MRGTGWMTGLALLSALALVGCDSGGDDDGDAGAFGGAGGVGGGGGAPGEAECPPLLSLRSFTDVEASITVGWQGEDTALTLDPDGVYPASAVYSDATPAFCLGLVNAGEDRDDVTQDWLDAHLVAVFADDSGAPVLRMQIAVRGGDSVFGTGLLGVGLVVTWLRPDGATFAPAFTTGGGFGVQTDPLACGGPLTLTFDDYQLTEMPAFMDMDPGPAMTLNGTFQLTLPDRAGASAAPEGPCDLDEGGLDALTSGDPARLPLDDTCLTGGSSSQGSAVELEFRAQPRSFRDRIGWQVLMAMPREAVEAPGAYQIDLPADLLTTNLNEYPLPEGGFRLAIADNGDGVGGVDWRAISGTLTVTEADGNRARGTVDVEVQHVGPCTEAPALTGEPVRFTADFTWVNPFPD